MAETQPILCKGKTIAPFRDGAVGFSLSVEHSHMAMDDPSGRMEEERGRKDVRGMKGSVNASVIYFAQACNLPFVPLHPNKNIQ